MMVERLVRPVWDACPAASPEDRIRDVILGWMVVRQGDRDSDSFAAVCDQFAEIRSRTQVARQQRNSPKKPWYRAGLHGWDREGHLVFVQRPGSAPDAFWDALAQDPVAVAEAECDTLLLVQDALVTTLVHDYHLRVPAEQCTNLEEVVRRCRAMVPDPTVANRCRGVHFFVDLGRLNGSRAAISAGAILPYFRTFVERAQRLLLMTLETVDILRPPRWVGELLQSIQLLLLPETAKKIRVLDAANPEACNVEATLLPHFLGGRCTACAEGCCSVFAP